MGLGVVQHRLSPRRQRSIGDGESRSDELLLDGHALLQERATLAQVDLGRRDTRPFELAQRSAAAAHGARGQMRPPYRGPRSLQQLDALLASAGQRLVEEPIAGTGTVVGGEAPMHKRHCAVRQQTATGQTHLATRIPQSEMDRSNRRRQNNRHGCVLAYLRCRQANLASAPTLRAAEHDATSYVTIFVTSRMCGQAGNIRGTSDVTCHVVDLVAGNWR